MVSLGPFHTGNFYFESQAKFRESNFREIFLHKVEHARFLEI